MDDIPRVVWIGLAFGLVCLTIVGLFVVDVGASDPDPVHFDDTVSMGLTLEDERALPEDVDLPRVQVFYSQYQYVVGYYGVETFVTTSRQPAHDQQFGYPLAVYVSDYSPTELELSEEGYPVTDRFGGWVDAERAHFVVDSEARTPAGETAIPFSEADDAAAFADTYGGTVVPWEAVLEREFDVDDASHVRDRVDGQAAAADELVERSNELRDRPDSLVVGKDAPTIQAAVDEAPAETTVVVPAGTYDETVEINRSITLAGEGDPLVQGDGNGSVITVNDDRVAITGLSVTGVGDRFMDPDADIAADTWDSNVEQGYGHGDAAIAVVDAPGVLLEDVTVETRSNGVLLRDSPDAVVRSSTITGSEEWREGFMGVMAMRSPGVIEQSTITGGRDGVYTHRSHDIVVRDNELLGGRFGVHLMHTSDALVADNHVRDQELAGLIVMTAPRGNAFVGNDVRDAPSGIRMSGSDSYVARNVLIDNGVGFTTNADNSLYEGNLVAGNERGVLASSTVPTSRVVGNAFIDNDVHAEVTTGPLRVWTHDGAGNYWEGAVGITEGTVIDRPYTPTTPVDGALHTVDGTPTLAQSLALEVRGELAGTVPGMREGEVVDTAPLCEPPDPDLFDDTDFVYDTYVCSTLES
ncbi:NosD domain-containing protein [Natronosalvus vescus]|uniref:NosD domain-containing protein n=1 Tax=Natronosalvus vescus TaxID=2953881 RepID=UPI00288016F2|nr:NosD domain-containing protein [Natronosalvus vescus]